MSRRSNRRWTHQYKCRQEQKKILVISSLRVEMVSHPPSHSGVTQALALPQIDAQRHNICLPSVVGHPATSSAPTRRSQQQLWRGLGSSVPGWELDMFCAFVWSPGQDHDRGRQVLDLESHRSQRTQQMARGIMEERRERGREDADGRRKARRAERSPGP